MSRDKLVNSTEAAPLLRDSVVNDAAPKWFIFGLAALTCLSTFSFGYQTTIVSPALAPIQSRFDFASSHQQESFSLDSSEPPLSPSPLLPIGLMKGVVVSSVLVTALLGALITGSIADRIGRSFTIIITELLFLLGSLICAFSQWYWMLVAGRLIVGLAVGFSSVIVSLINGEISPPSVRGQMGVINQLAITVGILGAYAVGTGFLYAPQAYGWRLMFGASAVLSVLHIVVSLLLVRVESPRWLVKVNRVEEARSMLKFLRRVDNVESELSDLQNETVQSSTTSSSGILEQFKALGTPILPIVLATGIMFFQQLSGINAVLYYLKPFLQTAGLSDAAANYGSIAVGGVNVLMTFVTIPLIDRLGRKPLVLLSLGGMLVNLMVIGLAGLLMSGTTSGVVSVVCVVAFVMSFAVGMGACPWAIINEMFPSSTRALAVSLSLSTNWGTNLFVALLFPVLSDMFKMGYILFGFALFCAVAFAFFLILLPETKGKSVEEIQSLLSHKKN